MRLNKEQTEMLKVWAMALRMKPLRALEYLLDHTIGTDGPPSTWAECENCGTFAPLYVGPDDPANDTICLGCLSREGESD
jgi:hypothetical protein